jgi:hypothetical protein
MGWVGVGVVCLAFACLLCSLLLLLWFCLVGWFVVAVIAVVADIAVVAVVAAVVLLRMTVCGDGTVGRGGMQRIVCPYIEFSGVECTVLVAG